MSAARKGKSAKRVPRCSYAADTPIQCNGVARWVTMNAPGNPTRMIWCDACHAHLMEGEFRVGKSKHQRLTPKLAAKLDRPWNWFPAATSTPVVKETTP